MVKKWIQQATEGERKGYLHSDLGIPKDQVIPITLLKRIKTMRIGKTFRYNDKVIKVTPLLKRRVNFALNVRK